MTFTVTYNFVDLQANYPPLLLPQSISMAAQFTTGEWYFAAATWTNYHRFFAESRILAQTSSGP